MSPRSRPEFCLFLSCEHGGNRVPDELKNQLLPAATLLETHRGYDFGALELFNRLKELQPHFSISADVTRLVVDLNRSLHKKTLFSEFTNSLSKEDKSKILEAYYFPFRKRFEEAVSKVITHDIVFHLSVHTFTPVLNGDVRTTDVGILYHPAHDFERVFAHIWKEEMNGLNKQVRVRYNYPYLGKPDGHVAFFRKIYDPKKYLGIELELNQKYAMNNEMYDFVCKSLSLAIHRFKSYKGFC